MNIYIVCAVLGGLVSLIVLEAFLAYKDGMLTPSQMIHSGRPQGMAWTTHFGASWGDLFIVSPLAIIMMAEYGHSWTAHEWLMKSIISSIITVVCHILWMNNPLPDCLAWGGRLTPAGWVHAIYMDCVLTIISLFYFSTTVPIDPVFLISASALLAFHIIIGNHIQWIIWRRPWWPVTVSGIIGASIAIGGVSVALFFKCRHILAQQ
jgi:hypothetical protein